MNLNAALLATAAAGAVLLAAACGGGGDSSGSSSSGSSSSGSSGSGSSGSGSSGSGSSGICQTQTTQAPAGSYLVAPLLFVAGPGPITVTVQAATPSLEDIFLFGASGSTERNPSLFNPVPPTAGMQAQQATVTPFQPGADIALGAGFRGDASGSEPLSLTARPAQFPIGILDGIANPGEKPGLFFAENAGVIQNADGVLIGFNPPGTPAPSTFSGFAVQISVSDVCVR